MSYDRDFGDEQRPRRPVIVAGELVRRENDPLANEAARILAAGGMTCPFCVDGVTGVDYHGEVCDCTDCDGHGWLSRERIKEVFEHRHSAVGTLMSIEVLAGEGDISAVRRAVREFTNGK